jgi:5-(carboxyamino)imidazole ribonucleotide mutase
MGSSSDLDVVYDAIYILNQFKVPYTLEIVSAHRTPHGMLNWADKSRATVIIAAAGGAAHLPGMIASATTVPVIGIPVKSTNSIAGVDSLLSICQMPGGIPVGTMAVNGAMNAGLYAIRMMSLTSEYQHLKGLLVIYASILRDKVVEQNKLPDYLE